MKVLKFGGTSVGNAERIRSVAKLVSALKGRKIVVLSAMSGTTNSLVELSNLIRLAEWEKATAKVEHLYSQYQRVLEELFDQEETRHKATHAIKGAFEILKKQATNEAFTQNDEKLILSQGELISVQLMLHTLRYHEGNEARHLPSLGFMRTDHSSLPDTAYIQEHLKPLLEASNDPEQLFVAEGFICINAFGEVDNLQRGGSDYTATLIAEACEADEIQIWTDIDGLHDNDPRVVNVTRPVRRLHFGEAAELAHFGAKILHPACIEPARRASIPVKLLNTLEPDAKGTTISSETGTTPVKAISAKDSISVLTLAPLPLNNRPPSLEETILTATELMMKYQLKADLVSSNGRNYLVALEESEALDAFASDLKESHNVTIQHGFSILAVVGDMGWHNVGFETRVLEALDDHAIRLIAYGSSRFSMVVVIATEEKEHALNALSRHLFKHLKLSLELE